ncbi:uncharacterized protein LOC129589404 [Paramacrobiotus metropolitanus]|uniref:uncharacterized protein LOC129589404 n=1 Tax=Paramacrobiotus metropolitanus TaxID=2943436 RepID=UPI002446513E|nr:uncharacterized protein LOC129589404 [Paramacrobiotus metropolitanus]
MQCSLRKGKQSLIPTYDLLLNLNCVISLDAIHTVFRKWGNVKTVHRPFDDRTYVFVRYEKKSEMTAAVKDFRESDLSNFVPEWADATVEEFCSNSHFEHIVREIPSEICDKDWWDCFRNYTAVRAVAHLPEVRAGLCDLFIALENQTAENTFTALLTTTLKYGSNLLDILHGTFIPPASLRARSKIPSAPKTSKPDTGYLSRLRKLRDYRFEEETNAEVFDNYVAPCTQPLAGIKFRSPPREGFPPNVRMQGIINLNFTSVSRESVLGTSSNTSPIRSGDFDKQAVAQVSSSDDHDAAVNQKTAENNPPKERKDPSDIWFTCGDSTVVQEFEKAAQELPIPNDNSKIEPVGAVSDQQDIKQDHAGKSANNLYQDSTKPAQCLRLYKDTGYRKWHRGVTKIQSLIKKGNYTPMAWFGNLFLINGNTNLPLYKFNFMKKYQEIILKNYGIYQDMADCMRRSGFSFLNQKNCTNISRNSIHSIRLRENTQQSDKRSSLGKITCKVFENSSSIPNHMWYRLMRLKIGNMASYYIRKHSQKDLSKENKENEICVQEGRSHGAIQKYSEVTRPLAASSLLGVSAPADRNPLKVCYNKAKRSKKLHCISFLAKTELGSGSQQERVDDLLNEREQAYEDRLIAQWQNAYSYYKILEATVEMTEIPINKHAAVKSCEFDLQKSSRPRSAQRHPAVNLASILQRKVFEDIRSQWQKNANGVHVRSQKHCRRSTVT